MARSNDGSSANNLAVLNYFPLNASSGPFTVQFWVKPANLSQSNAYLITFGGQYDLIWEFADDLIETYVGSFSGGDPRTGSGITLSDTNWHHIVFRKTGSGAGAWDRFLDGVKTTINASISFTINGTTGGPSGAFVPSNPFNGALAEIAVWMAALSDGDIATLSVGVRADTIGTPAVYWRLNGASGDGELDQIGLAHNLVLTGTLPSVAHPFSDGGGGSGKPAGYYARQRGA